MVATYGIIGTGPTKKNIIEDLLNEIGEDNNYILYGSHRLSDSEVRVLDWMVNHEVPFTIIADDKTSESFTDESAYSITHKNLTDDAFLKELKKKKGTLLLLWDDEREKEMTRIVYLATDMGIQIKDLTNGLVPIVLEDEDAPAAPQRVETDEVEIEQFSREELEGMPISVLRKNAKSQNINTDGLSKTQLVSALLGAESAPAVTYTTVSTAENTVTTTLNVAPPARETIVAPDGDCMVTVVMPNGTVISTPATMAEVRLILGLG